MVKHVSLEEPVELHFEVVAQAADIVPDPLLLFGVKCSPAVLVLIVHLGAVQIFSNGFSHVGIVRFQHLVVKSREPRRHHDNILLVKQSAMPVFGHVWHDTECRLQTLRRIRTCQIAQTVLLERTMAVCTDDVPRGYL